MIREIWKRNSKVVEAFLKSHYKDISRTTLRYAIEKFPENLRQKYLK
jgi:3-methyladenine DNA glycosylase AlkD